MAENEGPTEGAAIVKYDPRAYLASLSKNDGLTVQKQLAAAYDAACAALIGPNDVQKADGREFKKKSAWRKLARYFTISVEIAKVERDFVGDVFLATVTARAVAPWGQSYEEVGACATDEATGRRTISIADAIATASTRASNRAVSNLIAMGEVSAEEIGDRKPYTASGRGSSGASSKWDGSVESALATPFPFKGQYKDTPLGEMIPAELQRAHDWAKEKGADKFADFIARAEAVLADFAETGAAGDDNFTQEP